MNRQIPAKRLIPESGRVKEWYASALLLWVCGWFSSRLLHAYLTPRAVFGVYHPLRGDVLAAIGRDDAGVPK
jgi:hypothetical protein